MMTTKEPASLVILLPRWSASDQSLSRKGRARLPPSPLPRLGGSLALPPGSDSQSRSWPMKSLRFLWPVAMITLSLVALCAFTAVSLFHQQATLSGILSEAVASRRAAAELEGCLLDLLALLKDRVESVSPLHVRAQAHLDTIRAQAD